MDGFDFCYNNCAGYLRLSSAEVRIAKLRADVRKRNFAIQTPRLDDLPADSRNGNGMNGTTARCPVVLQTLLILTSLPLASRTVSAQQDARIASRPRGQTWVRVGATSRKLGPYLIYERINQQTHERKVFLKRGDMMAPRLIYRHFRGISVRLGNTGTRILVNDEFATQANKVAVIDSETGKAIEIDKSAVSRYQKETKPDARLAIVPMGVAFSADDSQVLIRMKLASLGAVSYSEAGELGKHFRPRWYIVEASSGRIVSEFSRRPDDFVAVR